MDAVDGIVEASAVLGSLDTGTAVVVSGVVMSNSSGDTFSAGDTSGPGVIKVESNPYASQAACTAMYEKYNGLVYAPYSASKAIYDPAAELGDQIIIGDQVSSVLYSTTLNLDIGFTADISAPNSEALSAEYPFLTEYKKLIQTTQALNASIKKTSEDLTNKVQESDASLGEVKQSLTAEVQRASGVEQELNTRIGDEATRAKAAEKELREAIEEIGRAHV